MEFLLLKCSTCSTAATFYTLGELDNHRLEQHERPWSVMSARLEEESLYLGRARVAPWTPDETHWHAARIAGREHGAA